MLIKIDGVLYMISQKSGCTDECSDDYILGILKGVDTATQYLSGCGDERLDEELVGCTLESIIRDALPSYKELKCFEPTDVAYEF